MNWKEFKQWSEAIMQEYKLKECWGYQIQPGTTWNPGISREQIHELEGLFGFEFPHDYKQMLLTMHGFDRDAIAIDPDGVEPNEWGNSCYRYPEDLQRVAWLIQEVGDNRKHVDEELESEGFNPKEVVGWIPLYAHRVLMVFTDKTLSPVISIHQGNDVIVYGRSLMEYWRQELGRSFCL